MSDTVKFANREEFREWLREHCLANDGIWLLFGKAGGPKTIKAGEALEDSSCLSLFCAKYYFFNGFSKIVFCFYLYL